MRLVESIKWFWSASAMYTNLKGIKLVILGFIPMVKFIYYMFVEEKC